MTFLSLTLAGRIEITEMASEPRRTKITATEPSASRPMAMERLPSAGYVVAAAKELFSQVSEIHPVLMEIGKTLWLVPHDSHELS